MPLHNPEGHWRPGFGVAPQKRLWSLVRFTISCRRARPLSARALVGCALRTRRLVHGMHPTEGNGGLYGSVIFSSLMPQKTLQPTANAAAGLEH